jgi:hypothetical protein
MVVRFAFAARRRTSFPEPRKKYTFMAGRRKVTVHATSFDAAQTEAAQGLDERCHKAGINPPKNGWRLVRIESNEQAQKAKAQ